jgi:hypothetical protein
LNFSTRCGSDKRSLTVAARCEASLGAGNVKERSCSSAAVGHGGHFSEQAGVDGESATMMRGVLDHGPHDFADGLAAYDRAGREGPREILRAARAEKVDGVGICRCERLAGGGERGYSLEGLGVFLEIEVEACGPGCALDEPVESLSRVRDLLRDGHHAFPRAEPGVGFIEHPGGAVEEILAGDELIGKVVGLRFWAHGPHYSMRRIKREDWQTTKSDRLPYVPY